MAGPVLREVVTRFKLETDEKDVSKFNKNLSTMKGGLKQLAALFGITLGIGGAFAIAKMGLSADRARFNLERMVDPAKFQQFQAILGNMKTRLDSIRKGASNILRPAEFNTAAAAWTKAFGDGEESMKGFEQMFEFASKTSLVTGRNVSEIMQDLQTAVDSGGFEALLDIPGFTRYKQQFMEFIAQARETGSPGGDVDRMTRMRMIMQAITETTKDQNDQLKKLPQNLLSAQSVENKMQETLQHLGDILTKILVPALEKMVKLLDQFNTALGVTEGGASKGKVSFTSMALAKIGHAVTPGASDDLKDQIQTAQTLQKLGDKVFSKEGWVGGSPDEQNAVKESWGFGKNGWITRLQNQPNIIDRMFGTGDAKQGNVTVTNNINIQSTDPQAAAKETAKQINRTIGEARATPRTEDR